MYKKFGVSKKNLILDIILLLYHPYDITFMHLKNIVVSFCIVASFFTCILWFHGSYASEDRTLSITQNFQTFLPLKKFSHITSLYRSWYLQWNIISDIDLQLIERDWNLVFWFPVGLQSGTWNLHISLWNKDIFIPLEIHLQKEATDFNIVEDMFQLSLQKKSLSCESAAASDIIASMLWKSIDEDEIIATLPKDQYFNSLPEVHPWNITIWGNPNTSFVWYIDHTSETQAKQRLITGYGVYEWPIAQVYQKYWFQTEILNRAIHTPLFNETDHLNYVLKKLFSWSMVQLWGDWCTREAYDDGILDSKNDFYSRDIWTRINAKNTCYNVDDARELRWKYYNDRWELVDHIWLDGEHAFILLWWKGDISNPTHIRVWDTDTGYHIYPLEEWMRKWEAMDYRSIIISKKEQ